MKIYQLPANAQCLIFDIDSTLYTNKAYAQEQIDVQIKHFAQIMAMDFEEAQDAIQCFKREYKKLHNKTISLGNTLEYFGIPISESVKWRETLIKPNLYLHSDMFLIRTLELLDTSYTIIALTNNPVLIAKKTLLALGITHFFSGIIGLDTTGFSKPHKKPLEHALELAQTTAKNSISIGDRYDIDLALPIEMGMGGILVDGVEDVYKLPDVLL